MNINKLIKKEINNFLKQYPNANKYFHEDILLELANKNSQNQLYEGLIVSFNHEDVMSALKRHFRFYGLVYDSHKIKIFFKKDYKIINDINTFKNNLSNINKLLSTCGWNIAKYHSVNNQLKTVSSKNIMDILQLVNDNNQIQISAILEPKFEFSFTNPPKTIYHIAPIQYHDKIIKKGLIPKSQSKISYHPDRIYCFDKQIDFEKYAINLVKNMSNSIKTKLVKNNQIIYNVYKINTKSLNNKWLIDYNSNNAIYTLENINPHFIKQINTITVNI